MNQAEVIFNSFSPEIQEGIISLVKSRLPKEEVPDIVRFDIPGQKINGYVEGLVNAKVAAEYLGIHEKTLYELVKKGIVPVYKPSGQMRFKLSEVASSVRKEDGK